RPCLRIIFPGNDFEGAPIGPFRFREEALPFFSTAPYALFNQPIPHSPCANPHQSGQSPGAYPSTTCPYPSTASANKRAPSSPAFLVPCATNVDSKRTCVTPHRLGTCSRGKTSSACRCSLSASTSKRALSTPSLQRPCWTRTAPRIL